MAYYINFGGLSLRVGGSEPPQTFSQLFSYPPTVENVWFKFGISFLEFKDHSNIHKNVWREEATHCVPNNACKRIQ